MHIVAEGVGIYIGKEVDTEFVFWDAKELRRRTYVSWNFIQEQFFFDKRFPKHKVGISGTSPPERREHF
ncbi:hypothetical protein BRE01_65680 [Brevibacillus reuszeri]|uniref:Uncharacterized protein n=1 Tax=Brevibacillus reuszeri TaxID=54915 RepID=A0ABQ0TYH3_9BACL|nr:hypothetical protein BRE01_65680 [Brevibacillus reuszeri]